MAEIRVERLAAPRGLAFGAMTFPAFRPLLELEPALLYPHERGRRPVVPVAVGALKDDSPAALALGVLPRSGTAGAPTASAAELLSLYVAPALRGRGLGTRLVIEFERVLRDAGCDSVTAVYMTGKPGVPVFEHILGKLGWAHPQVRTLTVKFTVAEALRIDWLRSQFRPRAGFEIFSWKDRTAREESTLRASQEREPWIPRDLLPWEYGEAEPISSLGARYEGAIVGWMINHVIGTDTVRFTCSFMRPDLGRLGRLVLLIAESVRRLDRSPYRRCTFVVPVHHPKMVRFVRRRVAPWVGFCGETRGTGKSLRAEVRTS